LWQQKISAAAAINFEKKFESKYSFKLRDSISAQEHRAKQEILSQTMLNKKEKFTLLLVSKNKRTAGQKPKLIGEIHPRFLRINKKERSRQF